MARYNSQGWHFQSDRHSKARKTGSAGGEYSSARIKALVSKHPEYKDLSFKQLKNKGVFLKYQKDSDGDGVKNVKDCRPLNKKAQDNGEPAQTITVETTTPEKTVTTTTEPNPAPKTHGKTYNWIKKEEE